MPKLDTVTEVKTLNNFYNVVEKTPLMYAEIISQQLDNQVYLKREDLQPVHSFKLRGAYYKMSHLNKAELSRGVIAASAGNHAQGVALAARLLDCSALIVMPTTTPQIKIDAVRRLGAEIVLYGESFSEAFEHSQKLTVDEGREFIHPFDDPMVIAGQSTIGQEIIDQLPTADYIFVPVGGGGLAAGIIQAAKALNPKVKVIGVEPEQSNAMTRSLEAGYPVHLDKVGLFADGVAVKRVGNVTFEIVNCSVDDMVNVTDQQICAAIEQVFEESRAVLEPAGALAMAGLRQYVTDNNIHGKQLVAICTGANLTFNSIGEITKRLQD